MSKYIKSLLVDDIKSRLSGVSDALVVDVIGLNSLNTFNLRKELRSKKIQMLVVKSSLAHRATEGTPLNAAFADGEGSTAVVWGSEDFVALCKEMVAIHKKPEFEKCTAKGGVLDGEKLDAKGVEAVSKWPNRVEQLSLLMGQVMSPGSKLLSQITGPGGKLLSQVKKKSEGEEATAATE